MKSNTREVWNYFINKQDVQFQTMIRRSVTITIYTYKVISSNFENMKKPLLHKSFDDMIIIPTGYFNFRKKYFKLFKDNIITLTVA